MKCPPPSPANLWFVNVVKENPDRKKKKKQTGTKSWLQKVDKMLALKILQTKKYELEGT